MLDIADDRRVTAHDAVVLHRVDRRRRNIDDDIARSEREIDARQPLRAGGQLAKARRGGHVERAQGRAGDIAGLAQAHAKLKALDRGGQRVVPDRARAGNTIVLGGETAPQRRDGGAFGARMQRDADLGPAAGVRDRGVTFGRLRRREEGLGLQDRSGVVRKRGFARGSGLGFRFGLWFRERCLRRGRGRPFGGARGRGGGRRGRKTGSQGNRRSELRRRSRRRSSRSGRRSGAGRRRNRLRRALRQQRPRRETKKQGQRRHDKGGGGRGGPGPRQRVCALHSHGFRP